MSWKKMLQDLKSHSSHNSGHNQMVTQDQWTMDGLLQLLQLTNDDEIQDIVQLIPHIGDKSDTTGIDGLTDEKRGQLWDRKNNWGQYLKKAYGYELHGVNGQNAKNSLLQALTLYWNKVAK